MKVFYNRKAGNQLALTVLAALFVGAFLTAALATFSYQAIIAIVALLPVFLGLWFYAKRTEGLFLLDLFVLSLPFTATAVLFVGEESLPLSYFLFILLTIFYFLPGVARRGWHPDRVEILLGITFLSWVATSAISFFRYQEGPLLFKMTKQFINYGIMFLHYAVLKNIFTNIELTRLNRIAEKFVYFALLVVLIGFYQLFSYYLGLPFLDIIRNSTNYLGMAYGFDTSNWAGLPRLYGFFPEASMYSAFLLVPLSFLLAKLGTRVRGRDLIFLLIFLLALLLTFARNGWFALAFLSLTFFLFVRRPLSLGFYLVLIMTLLVLGHVVTKYLFETDPREMVSKAISITDFSGVMRLETQKFALNEFFRNFWAGLGLGGFNYFHLPYYVTHNYYLSVLVETGVIGFIPFAIVLLLFLYRLQRMKQFFQRRGEKETYSLTLGLELAFISFLFSWFNASAYNFSYIWFVLALIGGLHEHYKRLAAGESTEKL